MARLTVKDKIAPYIEQGLSVKEISEITGYGYHTVYYAVFPEKRSDKKTKVKNNDCDKKVIGWFLGWNKDRKKCKTCKYRARSNSINGCDYIDHNKGKSRKCKVEDCDKYVRGSRLKMNTHCGKDDEFADQKSEW